MRVYLLFLSPLQYLNFIYFFFQRSFSCKQWEKEISLDFSPSAQSVRQLKWVSVDGQPVMYNNNFMSAEKAFHAANTGLIPELDKIPFPDPKNFVVGQVHENKEQWGKIFDYNSASEEVRKWVEVGVSIRQYLKPFKGEFWGETYDCDFPPKRHFNNSNKCKPFIPFINETIKDRLQSGAIECIGSVEDTTPPKSVVPLTVEPNKPRSCVNLMYLNNWIRDKPFSLDTLKDVPRVAKENAYFSSIDDKSEFDNVRLAPDSYDLVVFQWAGYFFRCLTLPFGFKLSSYIYHTLNLQPTSYIRSKFSVPVFLYIDDRLVEELRQNKLLSDFDCARVANYITCEILTRLGYCLNLVKSVFVPTQTPTFLGFVVDSVSRCFRLTEAKKEKFARFRDYCLTKSHLSVLELQQLAGKCSSFILAVPGSRLFTREMNHAISLGIRSKSKVRMYTEPREEIQSWEFLDT